MKIPSQKINWNKTHITGVDLQPEVVEQKFKLWDENKHKLSSGDPEVIKLLNDNTIYEYAFFTNEDDEPFQLTAYQDLISECILAHDYTANNINRYILYRAANQMGKSRMLISAAKYLAFNRENKNIVIISKSLPQSQFVLSELKKSLNNSVFRDSWKEDIGETANTTMLTITGKDKKGKEYLNRIICAPAGEGALGYPIHHLFLDEADFYEGAKTLFWKVLFARTKKTKGQIVIFTNPNPDISRTNSLLAELWDGTLFKRKFHFQFLDAPWNTQEEFDIDKQNSPAHLFRSTHLGEWSDIGGAFFTDKEIKDMMCLDWNNRLPPAQDNIYIAADLGKMSDHTVIGVGIAKEPVNKHHKYKDLDIRYMQRLPLKTPYDEIADRLEELRNHYKEQGANVTIGYDSTGQKTFGDFLKRRGLSAIGVDFSAKKSNKTLLYNDFKLMAEQQKLQIVYDRQCEKELAGLEYQLTANKKLQKVAHKNENLHDDYPDMIAILIHLAVKPSNVPAGAIIVRHNKKEELTTNPYDNQINKLNQQFKSRYTGRASALSGFW